MEAQSKSISILPYSRKWWTGASDYLNFAVIDNTIPATPIWTHQRLSFTSFNISANANCPLPLPLLLSILSTHHHPSIFLGSDSPPPSWNHIDLSLLLTKHCDKSSLLVFLSFFSRYPQLILPLPRVSSFIPPQTASRHGDAGKKQPGRWPGLGVLDVPFVLSSGLGWSGESR